MITEVSPILYRYDLIQPPDEWDTEFQNFEYTTEAFGHKNQASLFFFTDSRDIADDLANKASRTNRQNHYFITTTNPISPLNLIDFSANINIYQMLRTLSNLGIDVLTDDYKTYENNNTFSSLKSVYDEISNNEQNALTVINLINRIKLHTNSRYDDISLFGQRLTDFENGLKFRSDLLAKMPNADGYRWQEFKDPRGLSYCLLNANKLSTKHTIRFQTP